MQNLVMDLPDCNPSNSQVYIKTEDPLADCVSSYIYEEANTIYYPTDETELNVESHPHLKVKTEPENKHVRSAEEEHHIKTEMPEESFIDDVQNSLEMNMSSNNNENNSEPSTLNQTPTNEHQSMKRKRKLITLEIKLEIVTRSAAGEKTVALCREYNLSESTVRTIIKNARKIQSAILHSSPYSVKASSKIRNPMLEKMETLLMMHIEQENRKNLHLTSKEVRKKALQFYQHLTMEEGCSNPDPFSASKGWLYRFSSRQKLNNFTENGELSTTNYVDAVKFPEELAAVIKEMGYSNKQIFNATETGLFWKRLPSRTFINVEERVRTGFKAAKDRLSLLLCANAAGDCKLKPLLVYHSLNPRALRGQIKDKLPVHWTANKKAWVNSQIFKDWFINHFAVETAQYCKEAQLEFNILLLLDNAPGHPKNLDSINPKIKVMFLPPNTTSLIQPLDQGVIQIFKAYYMRRTISQMLDATDESDDFSHTVATELWKAYNIRRAVDNIFASWDEICHPLLNHAWKPLLNDCIKVTGEVPQFSTAVQHIVDIARSVDLEGFSEMEITDIVELIDSHGEELTVSELLDLAAEDNRDICEKKLAEFLLKAETLAQEACDMDTDSERSLLFKQGLISVTAPYKEIYAQKQRSSKKS